MAQHSLYCVILQPLEVAQTAALDFICSQLQVKDSDRLLDLNSGWGGRSLHIYYAVHR